MLCCFLVLLFVCYVHCVILFAIVHVLQVLLYLVFLYEMYVCATEIHL